MLNLYACGGAGVNIAKKLPDGIANVVYVDSSKSNIKNIRNDNVFLIEDMDGAGKLRATTYENFQSVANNVLISYKPSDEVNIVLSSLSGGSGSVIAPMLVSKLLEAGKNVLVIGIDSNNSMVEINNTINTLKTYKAVSTKQGKSIAIFYLDNSVRKAADDKALWFVKLIAVIIDKTKTEEFDTADLSNFINFERVTDNTPNVGLIDISENVTYVPEKNTVVVATIHITLSADENINAPIPEYIATCVVTDPTAVDEKLNARIDNVLGALAHQIDRLSARLASHKDTKTINRVSETKVEGANKDGMIL